MITLRKTKSGKSISPTPPVLKRPIPITLFHSLFIILPLLKEAHKIHFPFLLKREVWLVECHCSERKIVEGLDKQLDKQLILEKSLKTSQNKFFAAVCPHLYHINNVWFSTLKFFSFEIIAIIISTTTLSFISTIKIGP